MSITKGLNVKIGADVTQFEQSISKLNRQSRSLTTELRGINNSLKFDTKNPTLLAQKQQILNERYTATNKKLTELNNVHKVLNDEYQKGNISAEEYNEQMRKQGNEIAITESRLSGFKDELNANNRDLVKYSGASGKAIANMEDFGDKAHATSKKLAGMSVAATGLLVGMSKVAIDFESAFANVQKTMSDDVTPQKLAEIKKGIIDLSTEMPLSADAIAEVTANASQMGVAADNVLDFTEVMIKMGVATDLNAERSATAMARFNKVAGYETYDSVDRLGSAIVEMGNNFETTESEIMEMAMRLVAAGTQAGMTRAETIALSTALTSMGISAEAGGTAFSKVIYAMNDAVHSGSEELSIFAKTSGMTVEEFSDAFGKSAPTALAAFLEGLNDITKSGGNAKTVLEDLGMKEARVTSGVLSASSAHASLSKAIDMSNKAWEENIALNNEYEVFADTTENRINKLKNQFIAVGIQLGEHLLPHIENFVEWLGNLVDKFGDMDEGTQKFIVSLIGISAAAAPVLGIVGSLSKGMGNLVGGVKIAGNALGLFKGTTAAVGATALEATSSITAVGTAATTAGTAATTGGAGVTALSGSFGTLVASALPWVAGAAAIAGTGYLIYESLTTEAIPAVDLFADQMTHTSEMIVDANGNIVESSEFVAVKISEATANNVGKYVEMSDKLQFENLRMFTGITEITEENVENLKQISADATTFAIEQGQVEKEAEIARYQEMFEASTTITAEQKSTILEYVNQEYEERSALMQSLQEELAQIYDAIAKQGGEVTETQKDRIKEIQEEQRTNAISLLSETETEAAVIQNRMKSHGERMTAEQASSIVQDYNKMRDEAIAASEEQRDATVRLAEEMRSRNPELFGQMADDMINDANRMHTETVDAAEKLRVEGLEKLEEEYQTLTKDVNLATGEIATWWDKASNVNANWNSLNFKDKSSTVTTHYRDVYTSEGGMGTGSMPHYNGYYNNGLLRVPYDGFRPYLHKDERILKKHEADQLDRQGYLNSARNKITKNAERLINNVDKSTVNNNVNLAGTYHIREEADIKKIAQEITREVERKKR